MELARELKRIWNMNKVNITTIIIRALDTIPKNVEEKKRMGEIGIRRKTKDITDDNNENS